MSPIAALRRVAAGVRDRFDEHRHPGRRRAAFQRLTEIDPSSVTFICLGNICRSPYAERRWAASTDRIAATSAGFIGPGRPPPENARSVALGRGIDHADHRSRGVDAAELDQADALFIFDRYHVRLLRKHGLADFGKVFWLGDFDPEWVGKRAIIDPWGKDEGEFEIVFERIDRCVAAVLDRLSSSNHAARGTS